MKNIKLGDQIYEGVQTVRLDTAAGGTVDFAPYQETFAAGRVQGYNAGKEAGLEEGFDNGKAAGIQSEYDRFWDAFQRKGQQTYYAYAFAFSGWAQENFYPKYDMVPTNASFMFWNSYIQNLAQRLRDCGVILDTSNATNLATFAAGSSISVAPELSFVSAVNATNVFGSCYALVEIEKIILGEDGNLTFTNWFNECTKLATITFEGVIGQDINFQWSPLSVDSMKSVITHLKNYGGTPGAGTKTVKFTEACWTAREADSTAPDGNTWRDYVETTLGWLT